MNSLECGVVASRGWTGGIALTVDLASPPKCTEAEEESLYRSTNNMTESCLTAAPSTPMTSSTLSTQSAPGGSAALVRRGRASPAPVNRVPLVRQSEERRAKRCRFYRNGDRWFPGALVAVSSDRHRTWDSLLMDLTRLLEHPLHLAAGVRFVFTLEGAKIEMLDQLINSGEYVASSSDAFKSIDYRAAQLPQWRLHTKRREALHVPSAQATARPSHASPHEALDDPTIRPRLVTVLRNGQRPRRAIRVLLNRRTARALDQVMEDLSVSLKLDSGAVRKIYTLDGRQVGSLKELFQGDDVFIACGHERCSRDDFHLDSEESRAIQPLLKNSGLPGLRRRMPSPKPRGRAISPLPIVDHSGSLPRGSRTVRGERRAGGQRPPSSSSHISYSSSEDLFLPAAISSRYRIGRVLGDGNFAVVRECQELVAPKRKFALKIIDKSKCQGKEDMIQSEVDILRKVRHENIVRLEEEVVHCPDYLYLIMELVTVGAAFYLSLTKTCEGTGGDLFDAIAAATHYTESQAGHLVRDLAAGLQYLHHRNIVHRDVKPENLLVSKKSYLS
ncbi:Doublecortin domain [Trinorchestia longiramus]|nr:Doublecortin domain [Trinorchestia longiramus]